MKKILIVSATLKNNFKLANDIDKIIKDLSKTNTKKIQSHVISLENYNLPVYTEKKFDDSINKYKEVISKLTNEFVNSDGIIICGPEYNGSLPPIINNSIAWISTTTDYWRDAFNNKVSLIATNSGGPGMKFISTMKLQMEHLGCVVMPRSISVNKSNPLRLESVNKILEQYIKLL